MSAVLCTPAYIKDVQLHLHLVKMLKMKLRLRYNLKIAQIARLLSQGVVTSATFYSGTEGFVGRMYGVVRLFSQKMTTLGVQML